MNFSNPVDLKVIFDTVKAILDWSYTFYWDGGRFSFTFSFWQFVCGCFVTYGFFYIFNTIYEK